MKIKPVFYAPFEDGNLLRCPPKKRTKKEVARYRRWVRYLKDSKLSEEEIHKRAAAFTQQKRDPEND